MSSVRTRPVNDMLLSVRSSLQTEQLEVLHSMGFLLAKTTSWSRRGGSFAKMCCIFILLADRLARKSWRHLLVENYPPSSLSLAWTTAFESMRQMPGFPDILMKYSAVLTP